MRLLADELLGWALVFAIVAFCLAAWAAVIVAGVVLGRLLAGWAG